MTIPFVVTPARGAAGAAPMSSAGRAVLASTALSALLVAAPAAADSALARDKRCLNCHTVDRKLVGPAFKDIARRYAPQPAAADRLAGKIIDGGAGAWGPVPMPANPGVSPAEAKLLAGWVLGMK